MKRLELTPQLQQLIKDRVGEDVNLDGIAVFEAISLNNKPLPGKKGSLWEGAVATPLTLKQIKDHINGGGHDPALQLNHDMVGYLPAGRVFDAGLDYAADGSFELRTLFYLDATEAELASKIDRASSTRFRSRSCRRPTSAPSAAGTISAKARTSRTSSPAPARTITRSARTASM
jgi:hypothetical protein